MFRKLIENSKKNLILSAACGIDPKSIDFFLKSLRHFYHDEICFLENLKDYELKKTLDLYNCQYLEITDHKFDVQIKRYYHYLNILERKQYKNILLCDSRDIYFQADPFKYEYKGNINFFLESKIIKNCQFNSNWIVKTYGEKIFDEISKNTIVCSGTTLGKYDQIKHYLKLMCDQSKNFKYKKRLRYLLTFRRDKEGRGSDQAYANYISHKNLIENSYFYSNESGPIATVYYLKKINFNKNSQLLNSNNEPYVIVHQYDKRWDEFKDKVEKFKKNFI